MSAELYQALKILSVAEERSLNKQIVHALNEWLQERKDQENGEKWDDPSPYWFDGGVSASRNMRWSLSLSPSASPSPSPSISPSISASVSEGPWDDDRDDQYDPYLPPTDILNKLRRLANG